MFGTVLVLGMVSATQIPAGLGIVASFIREDLGINRTQVGALITTMIIVGAVLSPLAGRVTDVLGGRRSIVLLFVAGVVGYLGLAIAPAYWIMFIPVAIAGIAQAGGNPTTNKLIALHAPAGQRGVVTGIKQSGVQAGIFVSGLLMPVIAETWGWRWAFGVLVIVPAAGLITTFASLPEDRTDRIEQRAADEVAGPLPPAITFLAIFGALMGLGAAYTFLVPLFVEESLGMSERAGGLAAGVIGLTSFFGRILWARQADRSGRHDSTLLFLAVMSVVAAGGFWVAQETASWVVWPAAVMTGLSSSSWNSVGMLAVIDHAGSARSGRASGRVMLGFLTGLAIGPTLFGWLVDATGSYTAMWLTSVAVLGAAVGVVFMWNRRPTTPAPL